MLCSVMFGAQNFCKCLHVSEHHQALDVQTLGTYEGDKSFLGRAYNVFENFVNDPFLVQLSTN